MRVLVFSHEYPPVGGGGGRVAQDLCRGLVARGHSVRILTAGLGDLPARENDGGVEVVRLRSGRREAFRAGMGAMACAGGETVPRKGREKPESGEKSGEDGTERFFVLLYLGSGRLALLEWFLGGC